MRKYIKLSEPSAPVVQIAQILHLKYSNYLDMKEVKVEANYLIVQLIPTKCKC